MSAMLKVSYSAIRDQRTCEQKYVYGYVDGLRPKERFAPMELGTVIHDYWERFYGGLSGRRISKQKIADLHTKSLKAAVRSHSADLKQMAGIAGDLGAQETAEALLAIIPTTRALMDAYYRNHGATDAANHTPVLLERKCTYRLNDDAVMTGRIDMVTRDERGYWLWENKTTGRIPSEIDRFRDLQTAIYVPAVCQLLDIDQEEIAGIIWNQVQTATPHMPTLNKNGAMSVKQCVTTEELTLAQIKKAKLDPKVYKEFVGSVLERERTTMFPRYELPLTQDTALLLRDCRTTARRIARLRSRKGPRPVRSMDIHCGWCPFLKLCHAAVTGGDETVLRRVHYTKR